MGILFKSRSKLSSLGNLNPIQEYGLAQVTENANSLKIFDDPAVPLDYIRANIAIGPPSSIKFVVDNS
jgi:hypothetical protein